MISALAWPVVAVFLVLMADHWVRTLLLRIQLGRAEIAALREEVAKVLKLKDEVQRVSNRVETALRPAVASPLLRPSQRAGP